jgi:hypothetical protein
MSAWKIVVRRLHNLGGTANTRRLDDGSFDCLQALACSRRLGLTVSTGRSPEGATHSLTERGLLWCEGKLRDTRGEGTAMTRKSMGLIATWLRALPDTVYLPNPAQIPLFE